MLFAFLCLAGLAAANGANDVSRAAATLVGGRVAPYRRALWWTVAWTLVGSVLSGWLAAGVARRFAAALTMGRPQVQYAVPAMVLAALLWIGLSTWRRLPVATTHALVGALIGVAWCAGGWAACSRIDLARGFITPLVASPILSLGLALVVRKVLKPGRAAGGSALERRGHWVSAGLTALSRGINDSAKIWATLLPLAFLMKMDAATYAHVVQAIVAVAMLGGALLAGRRVTENLAFGVSALSETDSVVANVVTAAVIIGASLLSFPVASSHVVSGAILGVGLASNPRLLRWRTIAEIGSAWVITLPAAALLAVALYGGFAGVAQGRYGALALAAGLVLAVGVLGTRRIARPARERLIVFVCASNTSRSPMAARLCAHWLRTMRSVAGAEQVVVLSRGIKTASGAAMTEQAQATLTGLGVRAGRHRARDLDEVTAARAELLFCMTDEQAEQLRGLFPAAAEKVMRLHPERNIPNPADGAPGVYEAVAEMLREGLQLRAAMLLA